MPSSLRSTALAAAVCDAGVRVYTRTSDGDVREACHDSSLLAINEAQSRGRRYVADTMVKDWFPGELRFDCSPESALCSFAWDDRKQAVFYQANDGAIRERRHLDSGWQLTDFIQPNCMMGTSIAAVWGDHARVVVLFFQNSEGYLCYRVFSDQSWKPTIQLQKAAKRSGIGAASWDDCHSVRVYFQDEQNTVQELSGALNNSSNWASGCLSSLVNPFSVPIGDISVITWVQDGRHEIRIYFQEESCDIVEWCFDGSRWGQGAFRHAALPNSDISAYLRQPEHGLHIVVMWVGPDQLLHQRMFVEDWMDPTPITFLQGTGRFVGEFREKPFADNTPRADEKIIKRVNIRSSDHIDALSLDFTDGSSSGWHGDGDGGNATDSFTLNTGEDITHTLIARDGSDVSALQFITSKGRESEWYGCKTGQVITCWQLHGYAPDGFLGASRQFVHGLMPFWSERFSPAALSNPQLRITNEANHQEKEIEAAWTHYSSLRTMMEDLQQALESLYNETTAATQKGKAKVANFVKIQGESPSPAQ
ncbi:hypothetical protein PM082_013398 [Marasmius tenuissimus]|nr:hypothetical protein PM082_013398 [Marasmius tenuissimus]